MNLPETKYADSHGLSIAYQVMGKGYIDLIIAPGMISHVELLHEFPGYTRYLRRLAEFARVITFDKRGQGLSDSIEGVPTLEERVDDLLAVLDAVGSKKAAIFGYSEGAAMAFLLSASHPSRVSHIISFGGYGKACSSPTYEHMLSLDQRRSYLTKWADDWGKGGGLALRTLAPALAEEEAMRRVFARIERFSSSPRAIRSYFEINFGIDVLEVLPSVQVPTLVLARDDDNQVPSSAGRHLADSISNARYFDAGAGGHLYWAGDIDGGLAEIREFLTGEHIGELSTNRVLATVLFTDIVDSTDRLHKLGDGVWRDLLDRHDQVCSEIVELNRGRFIQSTGDGILATFDGPGRGVDCGLQLSERLNKIGLPIRAGLHIGEIELRNDNIAGASVHIAARIQSLADEGEVFVSRTVADLMVGNTGIHFESKGLHALKGFPGEWDILQAHG